MKICLGCGERVKENDVHLVRIELDDDVYKACPNTGRKGRLANPTPTLRVKAEVPVNDKDEWKKTQAKWCNLYGISKIRDMTKAKVHRTDHGGTKLHTVTLGDIKKVKSAGED